MITAPLIFRWDGESMVPWRRYAKLCDTEFTIGEDYRLEVIEERSAKSHSHYFAALTEAWRNLPEDAAERFPTVESLRKFALIKAGFCDSRSIVAGSKAEAQRLAAFIRPADEFAIVTTSEATVTVYTAKSQSMKAMGKADFTASKNAVLDYVAGLIGVRQDDLHKNAKDAA